MMSLMSARSLVLGNEFGRRINSTSSFQWKVGPRATRCVLGRAFFAAMDNASTILSGLAGLVTTARPSGFSLRPGFTIHHPKSESGKEGGGNGRPGDSIAKPGRR